MGGDEITPEVKRNIIRQFEMMTLPGSLWSRAEKEEIIWSFNRKRWVKPIARFLYKTLLPLIMLPASYKRKKRIVEKTISNCFRLGYVNEVFPDARIIIVTREGKNNINSLINGWLNPTRFFSYDDLPGKLDIQGYTHGRWNFVLPPGWEDYIRRPLEEVCAFQWLSCNEHLIQEAGLSKYKGRVHHIKLEDISAEPSKHLPALTDFIETPFDEYFQKLAEDMPVVNSPDKITDRDKWKQQNGDKIEKVLSSIEPMNRKLGYT